MKNEIFKAYPELECYFETSDGQKFFKDFDARAQTKNLESKKIKRIVNPDFRTIVDKIEEEVYNPELNSKIQKEIKTDDLDVNFEFVSNVGTSTSETPGTDAPASDAPGTETPGTETPGTDAPGTETPGTDAPASDAPGTETPGTETPAPDAPGTETPGTDAPASDAKTVTKKNTVKATKTAKTTIKTAQK